jgi:hypothetical protein
MNITQISYEMKRSNGNYGSDGVVLEAVLQDGESPVESLRKLEVIADYKLNGQRRAELAHEQVAIIATSSDTNLVQKAWTYIDKYNDWLTEVNEAAGLNIPHPIVRQTLPEENHVVEEKPRFPSDPVAKSLSDMVTTKQLGMIRAICRENNLDPEEECITAIKCKVNELSRRAASAFIDHLLAVTSPVQIGKRYQGDPTAI